MSLLVAVVGKEVGAALNILDDTLGGELLDAVGDLLGAAETLKSLQVDGQTNDVRSSHGGTGDGVGGILGALPGRLDVLARGEDINDLAEVGERGTLVALVAGGDGQSVGGRGRAGVASILLHCMY